jgi:hypothetical protein
LKALDNALALARQHVAEHGGNNRGPMVEKIIRYAGGTVGEPWCVDFDIYCYGRAGSHVMQRGYPRAVRLMVVPGVHITHNASPGCPVRFTFDHTGLLVGWRRVVRGRYVHCPRRVATHIATVEGNTSARDSLLSDSRDGGDGVYFKVRPLSVVRDFLYVER